MFFQFVWETRDENDAITGIHEQRVYGTSMLNAISVWETIHNLQDLAHPSGDAVVITRIENCD